MRNQILKVLIITVNWPAPDYSAAGVRMMQLISFFKNEKYSITLASTADKSVGHEQQFPDIDCVSIRLNHSSFDEFVVELNPDSVVFDRFMTEEQFGWRVAEHAPNALRILDTEDLHSLRKTREQALKQNIEFSRELWLQNEVTKREIASIYRSDLSLIISSFEMQLLRSVMGESDTLLLNLPFMMNALDATVVENWKAYEDRTDFVFIGFGGHAPNVDAISFLKEDVWPLIRKKLPEAKMHVYGGNLPQKIHEMHHSKEGFLIEGWTKNAQVVIESARILLAPLRFGAGLKGKLIDAMQFGTPSITTTIGAEGMYENLDWNGKVCDDPNSFAEAAITLYQNKMEWEACQQNGIEIINTIYNKKALSELLRSKIESLQKNLTAHRTTNFTGALLQHQTLASTKYMAKWIEEKNRG